MFCYPRNIESKIGFDAVRKLIATQCISALGKQRCVDMAFSSDFETVSNKLAAVSEMVSVIDADDGFSLAGVHDVNERIASIRPAGTHLGAEELPALRSSLIAIENICRYFTASASGDEASSYPTLCALASGIVSPAATIRAIDRIIDLTGEIKDNASAELSRIRREISSASSGVSSAMRRVMARAAAERVVDADASPAMRDGRLVIPVAPANKRRIPGIVHDESATGKTIYIEPAEVVEANNRLRELEIEERREILRILIALADTLRPDLDSLLHDFDILGDMDFIHAKARFAISAGALMPHLHPEAEVDWYRACHPVLALSLSRQGKEIVPLDITLTPKERILVISGPNAGGKSVALKTVAIVQYMAQCGVLPTLAENSHMGIFADIMIDIGDDQSIDDDLSTYSSHLRNMKYFLSHASDRSLILIDEFGSGTEPTLGGAIAQALLQEFTAMGCRGVITTHFHNLKQYASETPGLLNASMLYDRQQLKPLFKLSIGNPGSSFALEIARKSGLPQSIVDAAREIAGSDYVNIDKYLLDIARDRRYWENKRMTIRRREKEIDETLEKYQAEAETLHSQRREIINDAREQAQKILSESNAAIERTIHDIRRTQADKEATKEARRKLLEEKSRLGDSPDAETHPLLQKASRKKKKKQTASPVAAEKKPVGQGSIVLLDNAGTPGEVLEINGNNAVVAFGLMKTTVKIERLTPTSRKPGTSSGRPALVSAASSEASRQRQLNFSTEIDVRGMRVDEALQAVTYFIDDAMQFNAGRVRILHGTGTGALRQALRQYLHTVPQVEAATDEDVRFGGAGITVVTLK